MIEKFQQIVTSSFFSILQFLQNKKIQKLLSEARIFKHIISTNL